MSLELVSYGAFFLTTALTYGIICLGLNLQWGQTGLFNVGVAGFVAIGAYISALLTTPDDAGAARRLRPADRRRLAGGALAAAGVAFLVGALTLRLGPTIWRSPPSASPWSSSLSRSTWSRDRRPLRHRLHSAPVRRAAAMRCRSASPTSAARRGGGHALSAAGAADAQALGTRAARHPRGRGGRPGARQERRRLRLQAFVLGGAIMGLAGAVQAHFIGFIAPENYLPTLTFQVWAMLIVGGSGNNRGAILGAVVVWAIWAGSGALISALFPPAEQARAAALQIVVIGVALCAVLLLRPRGIMGEDRIVSRHVGKPRNAEAR